MARRCSRSTSRSAGEPLSASAVCLCVFLLFPAAAEASLYTASDQILLLTPDNVDSLLVNSSAAVVVEFYASWCGHCIAFSPVYKKLARNIKEWKPAVDLAAIDCASEASRKVCMSYSIREYPTIKFFPAYSKPESTGQTFTAFPRDVQGLRHTIIKKLETHEEPGPPACPPLEPASQAEVDSFFETNNVQHFALIFEEENSFIGREVILDLLHRLIVNVEARTFYSYALQGLPGVVRSGKPPPVPPDVITNNTKEPWRPFNSSRVYMADLESALHYSLRVEVATHSVIKGDALISLKKYIAVLAKYFPGRTVMMNLLSSANSWLQNQAGDEISYEAFQEILDNSAQSPDTALPEGETWVGCQGSQPHFRRYPCGVWTLFHVLTVQALSIRATDPKEVLSAMRNYIRSFFGCRYCAEHFENMARESVMEVNTLSSAVLWLWSRHNRVNNRLAGALSEDPNFPKIQWPSPEMCSECHTVTVNGDHKWKEKEVLLYLQSYFSSDRILTDYLESEDQILAKQREKHASKHQFAEAWKMIQRKARDTSEFMMRPLPTQSAGQEEEEGEEPQDETVADEEEENGEGAAAADDIVGKTSEPTRWAKPEMEGGRGRWRAHRKPSIVGMKLRAVQEDIVDLDSFVNQHYKAKASNRVKQRTLQRKEEQEPRPMFGLGMELDAGLGMVGLQPMEDDFEPGQESKRLRKRDLTGQYYGEELSQRRRWMSMLSIGFSKVDISLCVILYLLSSMCLLAMYLFFKNRLRTRRTKVLPCMKKFPNLS
ncbi:hypothetical protein Q5P01_016019 [Channa striata]|uniref:Sulfhydryl oxidase n=1 Tax=Channa striata TaxID=64152 RepID=A0AA88MCW9_CHASR|nr:hypothetical protein Q5P01_016019 [Channa striata]